MLIGGRSIRLCVARPARATASARCRRWRAVSLRDTQGLLAPLTGSHSLRQAVAKARPPVSLTSGIRPEGARRARPSRRPLSVEGGTVAQGRGCAGKDHAVLRCLARVGCVGMSRRDLRLLGIGCGLILAGLLACGAAGASEGILFVTPAVLLALPLLAGRYIGAERLARISRSRPRRRRRAQTARPARRSFYRTPPRGGLLIAASLAVRPPPAVRCVQ